VLLLPAKNEPVRLSPYNGHEVNITFLSIRVVRLSVKKSGRGRHLLPNHVVVEFKKLLTRAGLPNIRFHDLRHSAATLLLSLSVHPKVVQEVLGHTQISIRMP
jgi:integrase